MQKTTLTLREAADLLNVHWQTVRQRAVSGEIPAAKIGKRWVFLYEDVIDYIRGHYRQPMNRQPVISLSKDERSCSTSARIRNTGGAGLPHRMEREYSNLLKR